MPTEVITRKSACERKRRYATEEEAVAVLHRMLGKTTGALVVYTCNVCDSLHLGKLPKGFVA